jgi:hypothetical protein
VRRNDHEDYLFFLVNDELQIERVEFEDFVEYSRPVTERHRIATVFAARVRPAQDFQSGPGKPASSSDD